MSAATGGEQLSLGFVDGATVRYSILGGAEKQVSIPDVRKTDLLNAIQELYQKQSLDCEDVIIDHITLTRNEDSKITVIITLEGSGDPIQTEDLEIVQWALFVLGASKKKDVEDAHAFGPKMAKANEVSKKKIIPLSDVLAVVRNFIGLLSVIAVIVAAAVAAPAPVIAGLLIAAIAIKLLFFGLVFVQGGLFAGPQGVLAWGAEGFQRYNIARGLYDEKHKVTYAIKFISGALSVVEGLMWMGLSVTTIVPILFQIGLFGLHATGATLIALNTCTKIADILTFVLFNIFFSCTFFLMICQAIRDYRRHSAFRKQILSVYKKGGVQTYAPTLKLLRAHLMWGQDPAKLSKVNKWKITENAEWLLDADRMEDLKQWWSGKEKTIEDLVKESARKLYRLEEQMNDPSVIQDIVRAEALITRLEGGVAGAQAEAQALIEKGLLENKIILSYDKVNLALGVVGFVVGCCVFNVLAALGFLTAAMAADFIGWMPLNALFLLLDVDWVIPSLHYGTFKKEADSHLIDPIRTRICSIAFRNAAAAAAS